MKKLKIFAVILLCFFITSCSPFGEGDVANQANTTVTVEAGKNAQDLDVKSIMDEICSDEYLGRVAGTEENVKAGKFIKNYYEAIGLEPFAGGDYYQEFKASGVPRIVLSGEVDNVLGVIKGKDSSKAVVLSAHFDHVTGADNKGLPGAIDNASGVATLLEAAKDLVVKSKVEQFDYDIIIAAFNAEELGLFGCDEFVKAYGDKYDDWYNINIDCIGMNSGKGLAIQNKDSNSNELYKDFIKVLKENGVPCADVPYAYSGGRVVGTSDHQIFQQNGDAAFIVGQDGIGDVVHTPDDNLSIVDYKSIELVKNALVDFIIKSNGKIY